MKDINIKINGIDNLVKIQRYFLSEDGSYLIYSQDESDSDGNVKIYVAKVIDNNQVIAINTPEEWDKVKKTIVGIINDNKECTKLDVQDLDYNVLSNLEVTEVRALRLPSAVMQYLSSNQPEFNTIEIDDNAKLLEEKTENLKNINQEFDTFMNEMGNNVPESHDMSIEPIIPEAPVEIEKTVEAVEQDKEDKMSATMEIILPTKQPIHEETEEHPKKKKGKFNFKSLFGIKEEDEAEKEKEADIKVEEPVIQPLETTPVVEDVVETPVAIEPITAIVPEVKEEVKIVDKADLPEPTPLNPIVVENNVEPSIIEDTLAAPVVIDPTITIDPSKEEPINNDSGFDFFNTIPTQVVDNNINTAVSNVEPVNHMEVLTLEEDLKYKKMFEESEEKINELETKIFEMEKSIEIYEAKLKEIKNITQ